MKWNPFSRKGETVSKEEHEHLEVAFNKMMSERDALRIECDRIVNTNHRQAYCIQQCAAILGPDFSATIDGLPQGVRHVVDELNALRTQAERRKAQARSNLKQFRDQKAVANG